MTGRELPWWITLVSALATIIIFVPIVFLGMKLGDRLLVKDRIEVGMRASDTKKWRHGRITVTQGHFTFQPYLWQVRIPRGEPVELEVETMSEDSGRRPSLRQLWTINQQLRIIEIETSMGQFEIAGLPSHLTELRERLHGNIPA